MRRPARLSLACAAAAALLAPALPLALAGSATAEPAGARVQDFLADQLADLGAGEAVVMVHGTDLAAAEAAVDAAGLTRGTAFERIGVVVARGTAAEIEAARTQPGVTYLEGNRPITFQQETSNVATRGAEAVATLKGADGSALDGSGVSVGVIDSGIDPTHPYFREAVGSSAVVSNQKVVCDLFEIACTVQDVGPLVDTDTLAAGGHGTHVSGIVAGRPTTLSDGAQLQGAAPGAKLVSLATGAVLFIVGADTALEWVLENHEAPCGEGVPATVCPPIKVTNNSYGPSGGGEFDPESATAKLQRALAAEGVLTVWAAGNDGGDGSANVVNPDSQDPTPGILSVASYFDQDTGTRDGVVSDYSSRGEAGRQATYPDLSAPGEAITSSCRLTMPICGTGLDPRNGPGLLDVGTFNTISGTSMAAPHVAGIVAQLFEAKPTATPAEIEAALKGTTYKFTDGAAYEPTDGGLTTSFDKGTGLVDVVAAVQALVGATAEPTTVRTKPGLGKGRTKP
ncbi:S8 family peptidase [Nocardioides perillae]|uniref:Serine protease AprX n=1 Tax=Nocardioides perillae TaxID=1119534 RepID=A0A7Y9RXN5_9ACTN|nr:S8 family peptidase [Nocardioides perillae]NYG55835.1 serine protease AprX [Nocardioides perillae]